MDRTVSLLHNRIPGPVMVHYSYYMEPHSVDLRGKKKTFVATPQKPFRVERIVTIVPSIPYAWWIRILFWLFGWFGFPWIIRRYSHDEEEYQFRIIFNRPIWRLYTKLGEKARRAAMSECFIKSIRVRGQEQLVGATEGVPLFTFEPLAYGVRLALDTCPEGQKIEIDVEGTVSGLSIALIGASPAPPGYSIPIDPDYGEDWRTTTDDIE